MNDTELMRRALGLGRRARHGSPPNPWVGAVVVADGGVVGEGWTQPLGGPHAEVVALGEAGERAKGATMYVTLEPCSHHGRTPPCVDAIVAAGIRRVVASIVDPDPRVAGRGFLALRRAGVAVEVGVESTRSVQELIPYLVQRRLGRPWVRAKVAMTLDGRVADRTGASQWITSPAARDRGHELRAESQAVVVGAETMEADHPLLTARPGGGEASTQPERWVFAHRSLSYCTPGVQVSSAAPQEFLDDLGSRGVLSVLIEGGPTLQGSFFAEGLVDEVYVYLAPMIFGDDEAKAAFHLPVGRLLVDPMQLIPMGMQSVGADIELCLWSERANAVAAALNAELSHEAAATVDQSGDPAPEGASVLPQRSSIGECSTHTSSPDEA
ncbi:MAG: bifunctional diaminohydroxyphosphoribosylaminopyrimidine deaminase/5-amino-6-(5-phosphoribosylamino)uracil reductase RibD [Ferrimicrobium sp.]